MQISTCLVVKNERDTLGETLERALRFSREIIVVDTGSTDGTVEMVQREFGVTPHLFDNPADDPANIVPARNRSIALASQPWILLLDADERVARSSCAILPDLADEQGHAGFFGRWLNRRDEVAYRDYKLFLLRNGARIGIRGRVHGVPQTEMRRLGYSAAMLDELVVHHDQRPGREYRACYDEQMLRGLAEDPSWIRYLWFLGYSRWARGLADAASYLARAASSRSMLFPVESLNAGLHLATLELCAGHTAAAAGWLTRMAHFHAEVAADFEVAINDFPGWIQRLEAFVESGTRPTAPLRTFAC